MRTEYSIYKKIGRERDFWDGPFYSEARARKVFEKHYANDSSQDFVILKTVYEELKHIPPKPKKTRKR